MSACKTMCPRPDGSFWVCSHKQGHNGPHSWADVPTEYSPAFQDEYRRLWHEASAQRDRAIEMLDAYTISPEDSAAMRHAVLGGAKEAT